jgi:NADPH-dependent ferric siderophore reductase
MGHHERDERHETVKVKHELKRRVLTVAKVEKLTPRMRRVHFESPELRDFTSGSPDDHVKIFFDGAMRDFTPRRFDPKARTLVIDFALHEAGPATRWAQRAKVGDRLEIGGPKGSKVVPDDFDWYLLVGDESALPAIGRRVEELRAGVPVTTIVTIADQAERQLFETRASWSATWIERGAAIEGDADKLLRAVQKLKWPKGDGYVFVAGESAIAHALKDHLREEREHPKAWMRAKGYWKRGDEGVSVEVE